MTDVEIRGGAGEFEAAVIAVLIDHLEREAAAGRQRSGAADAGLGAWRLAVSQHRPEDVRQRTWSNPNLRA